MARCCVRTPLSRLAPSSRLPALSFPCAASFPAPSPARRCCSGASQLALSCVGASSTERVAGATAAHAPAQTDPMSGGSALPVSHPPRTLVRLTPVPATPVSFAPYGSVVLPGEDGEEFGPEDAELDLSRGQPRVYIMRLRDRKLQFDRITHHASVTQCLASVGGGTWFLAVCPPSLIHPPPPPGGAPPGAVQSKAGHWYTPPHPQDVVVFKVEGPLILKLHAGTWHAGPLFLASCMDFFNLELSDTNVVDHTTHNFAKENGVEFVFDP